MDLMGTESYNKYILIVQKRREMWEKFLNSFQNYNINEDVALEDLPMPFTSSAKKNNDKTKKTLNSNDDLSESDDLDTISDTNEDFEDLSEADSEDTAKFSDSDDENTHPIQMKEILAVYDSDSDADLSEDIDENNTNSDATISLDDYLNKICNSLIYNKCNDDSDDASECSDDGEESDNKNLYQTHGKRKYSETELDDDSIDEPEFKRQKSEFKNVNVYINIDKSDFETDSE